MFWMASSVAFVIDAGVGGYMRAVGWTFPTDTTKVLVSDVGEAMGGIEAFELELEQEKTRRRPVRRGWPLW